MCLTKEQWKNKKRVEILKNIEIAQNVYKMDLQVGEMVKKIQPGQFINLYCNQGQRLLPRPISICQVDEKREILTIVYGVVGKGTREFAQYQSQDKVDIIGPLGNGYDELKKEQHSILIGGGLGVPPLVELAKRLSGNVEVYLGFRSDPFLVDTFKQYTNQVYVATDDGSYGYKGTVLDLLNQKKHVKEQAMIYSCGPKPMLKNIVKWAKEKQYPIQVSLEERMACGVGACVGCVCKIQNVETGEWEYRRVCKDGPVFNGREVVWDE
ncbi:MAG: dihydroorotate dehydrogenase electron transfer subunit [Epulopiscium sp.]|nr:dihydroorotate dehydrogenase electron transfer subunit [Candidatus Epulonipiscium sp.]